MQWIAAAMMFALAACDVVFRIDELGPPDARSEACPPTYTTVIGDAVYRFGDYTDWIGADADCRDDSATAVTHLPVFAGLGELDAFRMSLGLPSGHIVHLGYARNLADDPHRFFAVTGEELPETSTMWADGEPDGFNGALNNETVVMTSDVGRMFDAEATPSFGPSEYFCQCDGKRATLAFDVQ